MRMPKVVQIRVVEDIPVKVDMLVKVLEGTKLGMLLNMPVKVLKLLRLVQKPGRVLQKEPKVVYFVKSNQIPRKEHKGIEEVYHEVVALFDDHPDLLDEFIRFLPDALAVASAHNDSVGRQLLNRYDERSSAVLAQRGTPMVSKVFSGTESLLRTLSMIQISSIPI
ncbi:hypothetical protein POM88_046180 [Heracleum sosnowskyi]|uniref:Uncharacterized protein n=1 Tax=Heracleum sosnowskyi TaxID=360622 RepID=A0AAD8H8E5_9APIA|nr:hypothetical protein POM88_046180 [Heracleum sosnowskyi]